MPDWFMDRYGRPHPVRSSPGYEYAFEGLSDKDKDYLRSGPNNGYTVTSEGREDRIQAAADDPVLKRHPFPLSARAQEARFRPRQKRKYG